MLLLPLRLLPAVVALTLAGPPLTMTAHAQPVPSRFEIAQADYDTGHYGRAFAEFALLADDGHCEAARIALLMWRYGKPLYATEFQLPRERLDRWQRAQGCPAAVAWRSSNSLE